MFRGAVTVVATYRCKWCLKTTDKKVLWEAMPRDRMTSMFNQAAPSGWVASPETGDYDMCSKSCSEERSSAINELIASFPEDGFSEIRERLEVARKKAILARKLRRVYADQNTQDQ